MTQQILKQTPPQIDGLEVKSVTFDKEHNCSIIIYGEKEEAFTPKKGNILTSAGGWILIFDREGKNNQCLTTACYNPVQNRLHYGEDEGLYCGYTHDMERHATPEEQQILFDALAKEGKIWNPDTLQIEDAPVDLDSFEGCCAYLGIDPVLPDVSRLPIKHAKATVSNYKLWVIAEAWNKQDGFTPDYSNPNQYKYYTRFSYNKETSAFDFMDSDSDISHTFAGSVSRLSFKTHDRSREFGEKFIELHNDVLLFEKA